MELDALIRSICLRDRHYMFFLGAGTSITSGIPSASECIWNWKLSLYLTKNSHINPTLLGSHTLPHVQHKIQKWLDGQDTYPALNSDDEYSFYVEKCFPIAADRQTEFKRLANNANPHIGYKLLGLLTETGKVKWIWTTNFDDLVDRGRPSERKRPFLQIGMDSTARIENVRMDGDEIIQVFLHGDYRYDSLKNTNLETQTLDADLMKRFVELTRGFPLIVLGYSGRDKSIMDALTKAYSKKGKGGLFWCSLENSKPSEKVLQLIETAKSVGNNAEIILYSGFDDFLIRLARYWLKNSSEHTLVEKVLKTLPIKKGFEIAHLSPDFNWIISNAYQIELPSEIFQFSVKGLPDKGAWKKLRDWIGGRPISAGLFKGKVLAMGKLSDITETFVSQLSSKIEQVSLSSDDLSIVNSIVYEISLKGLVDSLEKRGFERVDKYVLSLPEEKNHLYSNKTYRYKEILKLSFDHIEGQTFLLTLPDVQIQNINLTKEEIKSVKRDILWRQRNSEYAEVIKTWRSHLFPNSQDWRVIYPAGLETGFEFKVNPNSPVFTRLYSSRPITGDIKLTKKISRFEKFKAFFIDEPYLRFRPSEESSHLSKSIHPIKGLIDCGGPIELYNSMIHTSQDIRLGIICLNGHEIYLRNFLNGLKQAVSVAAYDDVDYVVDFPGFEEAFKCKLLVPASNNDPEWKAIPSVPSDNPVLMNQKATQLIAEKIRELETSTAVDVVIIYIPDSWSIFEKIDTEDVHLDIHDQIKALCAERGIRSQLIRESKIKSGKNICRLRWWLSLALFSKSLRIPWMLEPSGDNTAYVGIGYSINEAGKGKHIVLGCSHVFDSSGLGMQFRLSQLQNPIWKRNPFTHRENPFMSRDDAYLLGVRTRQLFYEAHQNLPNRVMICKRNPFLKCEIEGIVSALSEIQHVDLLTIQQDDMWRFCAYDTYKEKAHGFPVKRGTGLILDGTNMLLWLHGNVEGLLSRKNYFQGKSRIPTPVRVTRYAGDTPVEVIAKDLLALTKMDWNTFALYKQMPVTVTTPNSIAKIGRLLHRFSAESYDYRLFM